MRALPQLSNDPPTPDGRGIQRLWCPRFRGTWPCIKTPIACNRVTWSVSSLRGPYRALDSGTMPAMWSRIEASRFRVSPPVGTPQHARPDTGPTDDGHDGRIVLHLQGERTNHSGPSGRRYSEMEEKKRPAHTVRVGRVKAAIWSNEGSNGTFFNVTLARTYANGSGLRDTRSLGRTDLLTAANP